MIQAVCADIPEDLAVHYKEASSEDGFILTVFPMSADRMRKRYRLWRRLK